MTGHLGLLPAHQLLQRDNVVKHLGFGRPFRDHIFENLLLDVPVKELLKYVRISINHV